MAKLGCYGKHMRYEQKTVTSKANVLTKSTYRMELVKHLSAHIFGSPGITFKTLFNSGVSGSDLSKAD